ncbi:MAG: restriction endonuclease [Candidatus Peribacteraceae bacterium]|nr:restriction endonuclease [Candidatus Peribacteraceae bacterium]
MITYKDGQFVREFHTLEEVGTLSAEAFEYFSVYLLKLLGYRNIFVSKKRGSFRADGGVDIRAEHNGDTVVGQCKHWREGGGRHGYMPIEQVRALGGAMLQENTKESVFISTLPFSKTAKDYAASVNMRLIGPDEITTVIQGSSYGFRGGHWRLRYHLHRIAQMLGLREIMNEFTRRVFLLVIFMLLIYSARYWVSALFKILLELENLLSTHLQEITVVVPTQ